jgi:dTDP-4-dehydrorhamnose 3,5-epimerase-like enzyme
MKTHFHESSFLTDPRGSFSKFWTSEPESCCQSFFSPKELFSSHSTFGVIRGFHFQTEPCRIAKLIKVVEGEILDVSFEIPKKLGELNFESYILNPSSHALMVPENYAHGFQVLSASAVVVYLTSGLYSSSHDTGIHWSEYDDWSDIPVIVSERDAGFEKYPRL